MQTPPEGKQKRPAARKRIRKKPKPTRHRCKNCPKFFWKLRPNQLFCSPPCKDQFHNNRSGFGKLKDTMPKFIKAMVQESLLDMEAKIKQLEEEVRLLVEREQLRAKAEAV